MPVSNYFNINPLMQQVRIISKTFPINSVLDIGCGFGKYGFLMREFLDIRLRRYDKKEWLAKIDAVEIYEKYITPMHGYLYDDIYIRNIYHLIGTLPTYDIIIMSEVLEHLPEKIGEKVLEELVDRSRLALFVAFPPNCKLHDPKWDNPNEAHISQWDLEKIQGIDSRFEELTRSLFMVKKNV